MEHNIVGDDVVLPKEVIRRALTQLDKSKPITLIGWDQEEGYGVAIYSTHGWPDAKAAIEEALEFYG